MDDFWSSLNPQRSMPKILWKPGHDGDEHIVELASSKDFSILGLTTMKLILEFDVTWKPPPQCSTKVQADLQIAFSLPRPFPRKLHQPDVLRCPQMSLVQMRFSAMAFAALFLAAFAASCCAAAAAEQALHQWTVLRGGSSGGRAQRSYGRCVLMTLQ